MQMTKPKEGCGGGVVVAGRREPLSLTQEGAFGKAARSQKSLKICLFTAPQLSPPPLMEEIHQTASRKDAVRGDNKDFRGKCDTAPRSVRRAQERDIHIMKHGTYEDDRT